MKSPFAEGRFEHDEKHLYHLPQPFFSDLERAKPTFLIGARGSGKTTLLKALNWHQRLSNVTLNRQLGGDPFRGMFIGTYVKLPKIQLGLFQDWLGSLDDARHGQLLGAYFDLIFLELLFSAVADMLALGHLNIPSRVETIAVKTWLESDGGYFRSVCRSLPTSVSMIKELTIKLRGALEESARLREDPLKVLQAIPAGQVGSLTNLLAPKLADLCNHDCLGKSESWHFKVCMDEAECLTAFQQKVINTLIRLSEWPLFFVVSYVRRPADMASTLMPRLTHQKADRQLILLDDMTSSEFLELAEGVASVRCQEAMGSVDIKFSARTTLGDLDINRLLQMVIERSESPAKRALIQDAENYAKVIQSNPTILPIFEAYLAKRLHLSNSPDGGQAERRYEASREYRKKFVSAYLSICHELKVKNVPYASAEMVIGISDNCVRDFLSQLDHLYHESERCMKDFGLSNFLVSVLPLDVQFKAIRLASEEKRDSIPESGVLSPVEIGRVVKGLAIVTAAIQCSSKDGRHLRSTERGLFRLIGSSGKVEQLNLALGLVSDAADAGFLRLRDEGDSSYKFRVHASLAPSYQFSYRGAYYDVSLKLSDFERLKSAKTDEELGKVARSIAHAISGDDEPSLFSEEEYYDNGN
jgi:hypothetical protein